MGFFVDIRGIASFLEKDPNAVWDYINALQNELYIIGKYMNDQRLARPLAYQMGDGFFVHFDNVFPNRGTASDLLKMAVILVQRFVIKYSGMLYVGLAEGDVSGHSDSNFIGRKNIKEDGRYYSCGDQGMFFLMPITGTLLARSYVMANKSLVGEKERFEPRILIHTSILEALEDYNGILKEEVLKGDKQEMAWIYNKLDQPIEDLYKRVWGQEYSSEEYCKAISKYHEKCLK